MTVFLYSFKEILLIAIVSIITSYYLVLIKLTYTWRYYNTLLLYVRVRYALHFSVTFFIWTFPGNDESFMAIVRN